MKFVPAIAAVLAASSASGQLTTAFTYQGKLDQGGQPANGVYDFSFKLFDSSGGNNQIGSVQCADNVQVVNGLFTVTVDFGAQFQGGRRYLEISVRPDTGLGCGNLTGMSVIGPRQELTATPNAMYALSAGTAQNAAALNGQSATFYQSAGNLTGTLPGSVLSGTYPNTVTFGNASNSFSGSGSGLTNLNASNLTTGTLNDARLSANIPRLNASNAFSGANSFTGPNTFGGQVAFGAFTSVGRSGSVTQSEVFGITRTTVGADWGGMYVDTTSLSGKPFYGFSTGELQRAWVEYTGGTGVLNFYHVNGTTSSLAVAPDAVGIRTTGTPQAELDIYGNGNADLLMHSSIVTNAINFAAASGNGDTKATLYISQFNGTNYFDRIIINNAGTVSVPGLLAKGGGSFQIDHPLDPENKYLYHSFVESPDMKNMYDGVITTDGSGYATITLPDWFQALNADFRYQLTVLDDSDADETLLWAKVVKKVGTQAPNQFTIRTSKGNVEVSWQITGTRHDAFANANRITPEVDKPESERGKYLHPEAFGMPLEKGIYSSRRSEKPTQHEGEPVIQPN